MAESLRRSKRVVKLKKDPEFQYDEEDLSNILNRSESTQETWHHCTENSNTETNVVSQRGGISAIDNFVDSEVNTDREALEKLTIVSEIRNCAKNTLSCKNFTLFILYDFLLWS